METVSKSDPRHGMESSTLKVFLASSSSADKKSRQLKQSPPDASLSGRWRMHIEEIIIDGFKSYSTRVPVGPFDRQFNAITGGVGTRDFFEET